MLPPASQATTLGYAGRTVNTSVEELGPNKVRLSVEVPAADVDKFLDRTYKRLAGEVKVPGFRPGKAPRAIIDQRLGKDFVRGEALRDALPELYAEAVKASDLDVVAHPEIDVKTFEAGTDLAFDAVVETRPTPELKEYSGLAVTKPPAEVSDEEVGEQLEALRVRFATLEVIGRPLAKGDFALIDLQTYRHDEKVDELTAKDLLVEVGAEMLIPELDAELEGKRKGDILKITATLPERFGDHAGWQVGMQILVKEAKARKLPELDEDFAKTVSEFDTLDELRGDLRERMQAFKEARADMALRENVMDAFVNSGVAVDLPEGMVHLEVDGLIESMARVLQARGATLQAFLDADNIDLDALRQRYREQAERNLMLRLGLDALAAAEGVEATEEDRSKEVARIAERVGREADEVREAIEDAEEWGSVDGDILRAKALDLLVERADVTITEEEPTHEPY
jgi:trigger factor